MATLEELVVEIIAETSGLRAELAGASKATKDATKKMNEAIEEFSKNSSKNVGFFETAMATMTGFLAAEATKQVLSFAADAFGFLLSQLQQGVRDADREQQAMQRLANAMGLAGNFTNKAAEELSDYASKMENLTGVNDDVVLSNLAVLSSLTRLDTDGLQRAQTAALDMSAALGIDLESATRLVGKGVEGNVEAFKRYGIQIQEGSSKAENLKNVLTALESRFQGSAKGAMNTYDGALLRVSNSWGNIIENLGKAVVENQAVVNVFNKLADIFNEVDDGLKDNKQAMKELVAQGIVLIIEGLEVLVTTVNVVVQDFDFMSGAFDRSLSSMGYSLTTFFGIFKTNSGDEWAARWAAAKKQMDSAFENTEGVEKINKALDRLKESALQGYVEIQNGTDKVSASTKKQGEDLDALTDKHAKMISEFAKGLYEETQALDYNFKSQNEMRQANLDAILAQEDLSYQYRLELMQADFDTRNEMLAEQQEKEINDLLASNAYKIAEETKQKDMMRALTNKHYVDQKKLDTERLTWEQMTNKQRMNNFSSTMGYLTTLSQSSNKELVAIGKAAAITQATIDGYAAVQVALKSAPPPFSFALAALVGAAAAANVAKIAGVGLRDGGTIAGGGANVDTVPATLAKGETVITRGLTDQLGDFLNENGGQGGGGSMVVELRLKDSLVEFIEAKILERQATNTSLLVVST